jgi:diadenosine tetraphosphate (Ap4A) HIT family hydrolase
MPFRLHPRLRQDCIEIGRLPLCRLQLMNDRRYPWCILVPQRPDVEEIHQLSDVDQTRLIRESSLLSRHLSHAFRAHKMNVAVLGNLVPQLHVHHVVRHPGDPAWPGPVWGHGEPLPYSEEDLEPLIEQLRKALLARPSPMPEP